MDNLQPPTGLQSPSSGASIVFPLSNGVCRAQRGRRRPPPHTMRGARPPQPTGGGALPVVNDEGEEEAVAGGGGGRDRIAQLEAEVAALTERITRLESELGLDS